MEKTEVWKSLDFMGYPDYEISTLGRVKSLNYRHTGKEKILKYGKGSKGYLFVNLYKDGKRKLFRVHKLVSLAFIPNPLNLPQINHKDENKENNKVENLEWCTVIQNLNYGTRNERVSKSNKGKPKSEEHKQNLRKANSKPILQFSLSGEFIREWDSATSASKELNIYQSNITNCCKSKLKTCGGFLWKYKE